MIIELSNAIYIFRRHIHLLRELLKVNKQHLFVIFIKIFIKNILTKTLHNTDI